MEGEHVGLWGDEASSGQRPPISLSAAVGATLPSSGRVLDTRDVVKGAKTVGVVADGGGDGEEALLAGIGDGATGAAAAGLEDVGVVLPFSADDGGVRSREEAESEETLGLEEQQILAQIHELQRKLQQSQVGAADGKDGKGKGSGERSGEGGRGAESLDASVLGSTRRLVVVSNRLPVSFSKDEESGEWTFTMSSGGLVSALQGTRSELPFVWVGWLGRDVPEEDRELVKRRLWDGYSCVPVFVDPAIADDYYNGFSNAILWPVLHYVPMPTRTAAASSFDRKKWEAYKSANKQFAEVIGELYEKGDVVWIQDYHLMVLPAMLRARVPKMSIGWFLHTPFPSSEVYRVLPVRDEILKALLAADLLGFHTYDYARHFLSACARLLGAKTSPSGIEYKLQLTTLGVFPIGIDPTHFEELVGREDTIKRIEALRRDFAGQRVLLGVDRVDYIKGIPHKLLAVEHMLREHEEWQSNIVLIQVGVPSRTGVQQYKELNSHVNELVGRINGHYGTLSHSPIHYINRSVDPVELCALYAVADVLVVTSVRDGMNLVCQEYVACQGCVRRSSPGVLVLSEFAGSSQSLSGAIRVNPWNTAEVASALNTALHLNEKERQLRHEQLYRYVSDTNTAAMWAKSFVTALLGCGARGKPKASSTSPSTFAGSYRKAARRLIVINCDGVLAVRAREVEAPAPAKKIRRIVKALGDDPKNTVILISSRDRAVLTAWFGRCNIAIAAEHATLLRFARSASAKPVESPVLARGESTSSTHSPLPDEALAGWVAIAEGAIGGVPLSGEVTTAPTSMVALLRKSGMLAPARPTATLDMDVGPGSTSAASRLARSRGTTPGSASAMDAQYPLLAPTIGLSRARLETLMAQNDGWRHVVRSIMRHFEEITPGAEFFEKENTMGWHYAAADAELGVWQAQELQMAYLEPLLADKPAEVVQRRDCVEVLRAGASQTLAVAAVVDYESSPIAPATSMHSSSSTTSAARAIHKTQYDFLMCIGSEKSDNELFRLFESVRKASAAATRRSRTESPPRKGIARKERAAASVSKDDAAAAAPASPVRTGAARRGRRAERARSGFGPFAHDAKVFTVCSGRNETTAQHVIEPAVVQSLLGTFATISRGKSAATAAAKQGLHRGAWGR